MRSCATWEFVAEGAASVGAPGGESSGLPGIGVANEGTRRLVSRGETRAHLCLDSFSCVVVLGLGGGGTGVGDADA